MTSIAIGIIIPLLGTSLGAACVFIIKDKLNVKLQQASAGFAGGVMVAASVWSLLIPAINMAEETMGGRFSFVPPAIGFLLGIVFLLIIDKIIQTSMLFMAVTLHNIPEGMAVGIAFAGILADNGVISLMGAFSLAIGIAIQNFPEGAIISMPLRVSGLGKKKAFLYGTLSGIVEPLGALVTLALSHYLLPFMPYLLSFAAGAMVYVVVEELIPESAQRENSKIGTISFAVGFALMMALDVALG